MDRLRLYYPVRPFSVNQAFGENRPCVRDFGLPSQSVVTGADNATCPAGYDKLYQHFGMDGHNGMDLAAGEQNVYAACAGTVVEQQTVPARGLGLGILTDEQVDFGYGQAYAKVRYWHLKSFYASVGDRVEAGQLIGVTDNTGYSSGSHLHFELDPMSKDDGGHPQYATLPTRMIAGSVDPAPFFTGTYADAVPQIISLSQRLVVVLQQLINYMKSKQNA